MRRLTVAFLFDTDAISEALRSRPDPSCLSWLGTVARDDQFASAITVGELFYGAYRAAAGGRHLAMIEDRVLPSVTVLPFDGSVTRAYGRLAADLADQGQPLADADLQIAATALHHDLELVTGNLRRFARIPELRIRPLRSTP
ncbi:MAG: PIN domain-containing protein [Trueperaceae bacterium]|nr:PIN domain-containing protein [Trueperaceae bacterium]